MEIKAFGLHTDFMLEAPPASQGALKPSCSGGSLERCLKIQVISAGRTLADPGIASINSPAAAGGV